MNDHVRHRRTWWPIAAAVLLAAAGAATGAGYLHEDARIEGKEIHSFEDDGRQVSVVLGSFRLTLGKHSVSGRDAVLWIRSSSASDGHGVHEITVYVEGDARVVEPGRAVTTDRTMLVTVRNRGMLRASGTMSDRPLKQFPLYQRAVAQRKASRQVSGVPAGGGAGPELTITTQPVVQEAAKVGEKPAPPVRVSKPTPIQRTDPVHFHAAKFTSQEIGEGPDKRRATIARGNVYLSQGQADSELFLELRAQRAVVFSRQRQGGGGANVPWAPKVRGMKLPGGGEEAVTGVYLEGDVVISRGERFFRGPAAYYDFTSYRAYVCDPVFRTVQTQRNVPIYIRATEARILSEREAVFTDAKVSTSDFYTPTYHIGARRAQIRNETPYDETGERLGEHRWLASLEHATLNVRDVPVGYLPKTQTDFTQGHTALRQVEIGQRSNLGFGGQTEWHLFRLLGLLRPKGFKGTAEFGWYDRGPIGGINLEYERESFSGYSTMHGLIDDDENDDFGRRRENIEAPGSRGRILARHKQFLAKDWQLQFELSYLCDRNYLEQFFPGEFYAGKEQETLLYAKKQRDNWAFTTLLQYRLNRFEEQTESAPEVGFHLVGEPLLDDRLTFFSESRAGAKRFRRDEAISDTHGDFFARLDSRNEIDWPMHFGPLNVVPWVAGRATYWSDRPEVGDVDYMTDEDGRFCRLWGQVGARANMHVWRVYPNVRSRLWDLRGMKHVITPEVVAFLSDTNNGARPEELWPMDPDIEEHLFRQSGVAVGVSQRLQTKRGPADEMKTVDWMRLKVVMGVYDNGPDTQPADGRFFFYRPEYSLGRNHVNAEYLWNISDSTAFLSDVNWDMTTSRVRRWNVGMAVSRDPRLRYYLGVRRILDHDSAIGTVGLSYQINRKYSVSAFQQVDMDYNGHRTLATRLTLVRKFPRWYVGGTLACNRSTGDIGLYVTLWPEGIPEARIGSGRYAMQSYSDRN